MPDLPTLTFKKGEAVENVQLTITEDDSAKSLVGATLTLTVATVQAPGTAIFTKNDADFDKTNAANGIVTVDFSAANLATEGSYVADLKIQYSDTNIRKTEILRIQIGQAITS